MFYKRIIIVAESGRAKVIFCGEKYVKRFSNLRWDEIARRLMYSK